MASERQPKPRGQFPTTRTLDRTSAVTGKAASKASDAKALLNAAERLSLQPAVRQAAGTTARALGPAGKVLDLASTQSGYMADTRRMTADEAFLNNYGGGAVRATGEVLGTAVGGTLGFMAGAGVGAPIGAAAGYFAGKAAGDSAAKVVLPAYRGLKAGAMLTLDRIEAMAMEASRINNARYWPYRVGPYR